MLINEATAVSFSNIAITMSSQGNTRFPHYIGGAPGA